MIEGGNMISTHGSYSHDHTVTNCLHDDRHTEPEGGASAAVNGAESDRLQQAAADQEGLSANVTFLGGIKKLFSRDGFFGRIWYSDVPEAADRKNTAAGDKSAGGDMIMAGDKNTAGDQIAAGENTVVKDAETAYIQAGILASGAVKPAAAEDALKEETTERKVGGVEGAVSGGLKKEQGGIRKFLNRFGEQISKMAGRSFGKQKRMETVLSEADVDAVDGKSSYLLDSYNRSGEYSTLAKDRSMEGNFKARG